MSATPYLDDVIVFAARAVADAIIQNRKFPQGPRRVDVDTLAQGLLINYLGDAAPKPPNREAGETICTMSVLIGRVQATASALVDRYDGRPWGA